MATDNKHVVRVLVGQTWYEVKPGSYKSTKTKGFEFTDNVSGRRVSGPESSVIAVESDG
jgi:hypothetical protein